MCAAAVVLVGIVWGGEAAVWVSIAVVPAWILGLGIVSFVGVLGRALWGIYSPDTQHPESPES